MHTLRLLALVLVTSYATAQDGGSPTLQELAPRLTGQWSGEMTYLDGASGERVTIPADLRVDVSETGAWMIRKLAYEDPGEVVRFVEVASIERNDVRSALVYREGVDTDVSRMTSYRTTTDGWAATLKSDQRGERVDISLSGDSLTATTLAMAGSEWAFRNELRLVRRPDATSADLLGVWRVDVRPAPDAQPVYTDLIISNVADSVEGSFYSGSPMLSGKVNAAWGEPRIAFITQDNSGQYASSAVLRAGVLHGTTYSSGRGSLWVWTATRSD